MSKPVPPCKDCEERQLGCHDICPKYQAFKREKFMYNLQLAKIKDKDVYFHEKAKENARKSKSKK